MTKIYIKFSNIKSNSDEVIHRLRTCKTISTPIRRKLLKNIKNGDWYEVIKELVYRFEGYCEGDILNYKGSVIRDFIEMKDSMPLEEITKELYKRFI